MNGVLVHFLSRQPRIALAIFLMLALWVTRALWNDQEQSHLPLLDQEGLASDPKNLRLPDLPDKRNAGVYMTQAVTTFLTTVPQKSNHSLNFYLTNDQNPFWQQSMSDMEDLNAPIFEWVDNAYAIEEGYFNTNIDSAVLLGELIHENAAYENLKGNPRQAIVRLLQTLHAARIAGNNPDARLQFDSQIIRQSMAQAILQMTHFKKQDLPEIRQSIEKLIVALLDESQINQCALRSLNLTILMQMQSFEGYWLKPWVTSRQNRGVDALCKGKRAMLHGNWTDVYADPQDAFDQTVRLYLYEHYRSVAETRIAATALAIRLYRLDHDMKWPDKLDDLVPQYLPKVPDDPFHRAGTPIGYQVLPGDWEWKINRPVLIYDGGLNDLGPDPKWPTNRFEDRRGFQEHAGGLRQYRDLRRLTKDFEIEEE
jgi:hypothetical protein